MNFREQAEKVMKVARSSWGAGHDERLDHVEAALVQAHAEGRRSGLEEAASIIQTEIDNSVTSNGRWTCSHCTGYADDDVLCTKCIKLAVKKIRRAISEPSCKEGNE